MEHALEIILKGPSSVFFNKLENYYANFRARVSIET